MNNAVIIYVVLLIVIVALVYFFINPKPATNTTTIPTSSVNYTTTVANLTNTTINTTTTIPNYNYSGCIQTGSSYPIANGNFGTGNFEDWNATTDGFLVRNLSSMNANGSYYDAPWSGTNASYFASTYDIGTVVNNGNLTSNQFQVVEPYLDLQIISPQDNLIYLELLRNNTVFSRIYFNSYAVPNNTHAESTFQNASITLVPYLCQNIKVRVVAADAGNRNNIKQYIAVTNFHLSKLPDSAPNIIINQTPI